VAKCPQGHFRADLLSHGNEGDAQHGHTLGQNNSHTLDGSLKCTYTKSTFTQVLYKYKYKFEVLYLSISISIYFYGM